MKSKAVIKGHPLHPMLIPFPFAFLTGAVAFEALARLLGEPALWTTAGYLIAAGVATGLLAAVPGLIDYALVVPPRSSGKRRATQHMLANGAALLAFAAAWLLRGDALEEAGAGPFLLQVGGLVLLSAGGWMGGTLVYRNQIGVDHRYAGAGKWQESTAGAAGGGKGIVAGREDDLQVDQMKLLHVNGRRIVLARTADGYAAFDDRCTHRGASLADGVLICGIVQCPWHGSQFDVESGAVKAGPAEERIECFDVRVVSGELRLQLEPRGRARRAG